MTREEHKLRIGFGEKIGKPFFIGKNWTLEVEIDFPFIKGYATNQSGQTFMVISRYGYDFHWPSGTPSRGVMDKLETIMKERTESFAVHLESNSPAFKTECGEMGLMDVDVNGVSCAKCIKIHDREQQDGEILDSIQAGALTAVEIEADSAALDHREVMSSLRRLLKQGRVTSEFTKGGKKIYKLVSP